MVFLASNHILVLIGSINTRRNSARRLEEEVAYAGAPPHDEQVPPLKENANVDQAPANPPPMTTQALAETLQAQAMKAQADRDVAPCHHQ